MNRLFRIGLVLLLIMGSAPLVYAQELCTNKIAAESSFNPTNPAEPDNETGDNNEDNEEEEVVVYYRVTVSSNPSSVGNVPSGGEFTSGSSKYIYTSSKNSKYEFSHWTLNGEFYSNSLSFTYKVGTEDVDFVAHYKFVPSSPIEPDPMPEEPEMPEKKVSPLFLTTNVEGACSFNQPSGHEYVEDTWISLEAFVAKGYEFKGWYRGTTLLSKNRSLYYQMPSEPVTLIAYVERIIYNPNNPSEPEGSQDDVAIGSYNLIYVVDGEEYETVLVKFGTSITLIAPLCKEGYTFSGWSEVPATMPANDVVVTGSFSVNSYTITYVVDGEEFKSVAFKYGESVMIEDVPIKEGYTFSGWSEVPEIMPAEDVTVSGFFIINKYLVTFKIGEEVISSESMEYGSTIVVPEAPEREGYTFDGWGEVAETVPAGDVTYEGSYSVNSYLLTYMVDGETINVESIAYGTEITLLDEPVKEGYTFSGWSEVPETMPAEDVIVSGFFTVNTYKVYYYVGEELVHTAEVAYGESIPEYVYETTVEGDEFMGWIGETYETMPAHDVTYTANITNEISQSTKGDSQLTIYDLNGRKIQVNGLQELSKGIYIVNGKKVVIK